MTRKHFELLAESLGKDIELNESLTAHSIDSGIFTRILVEDRIGYTLEALAKCNPNFDEDRFIEAVIKSAVARREEVLAP